MSSPPFIFKLEKVGVSQAPEVMQERKPAMTQAAGFELGGVRVRQRKQRTKKKNNPCPAKRP